MKLRRLLALGLGMVASFPVLAVPAAAVTFASFTSPDGTRNFRWVKSTGAGTDAAFYTTASASGNNPAVRPVDFSFLQPGVAPLVTNHRANFILNGSVTDTIATIDGADVVQTNLSGTFSFTSTSLIILGDTQFVPGSTLLSGKFSQTTLRGVRGSVSANWLGVTPASNANFTYNSDFLTFANGAALRFDFDLSDMSALNAAPIFDTPTSALSSGRSVLGGSFASDPAPTIPALVIDPPVDPVPEPASWAMLIAGFGLVGGMMRRRRMVAA